MARHLALIIGISALAACEPRTAQFSEQVLSGYYSFGIETEQLIALGVDGPVCLAASSEVRHDLSSIERPVFVVLAGDLSERGRYGHMGNCTHLFRVSRVLEARPITEAERVSRGIAAEAQEQLDPTR